MTSRLLTILGTIVLTSTASAADAPATGPCKAPVSFPAYGGIVQQNPNPGCVTLPGIGDVFVGGILTGYAVTGSNPLPASTTTLPSDQAARADVSNLQAVVQKADGPFQAYLQAGLYSVPTLGAPIYATIDQTRLLFGPVPVVYGKYVVDDAWSIQGGRLPTLIGAETTFTVQNLNVTRGLLFGQENAINQGVQVNYAKGPWTVSAAGTDGFFSGRLDWVTGLVSYKIDDAQTVTFDAGGNVGGSAVNTYATPLPQNNSGIYNLIYTYAHGPWIFTPYLQYTDVGRDQRLGIAESASTYGGAILASYAVTDHFALAGRVEYEQQTGRRGSGTTSLLYGAGSSAASLTLTPTFTFDRVLLRGEYSHVDLSGITRGDAAAGITGTGFGRGGDRTTQDRFLVEGGITF